MSINKKIILKIKEIIPQKGERTKVISEQISLWLKRIPELVKYINEKDPLLKEEIFYDLGRYMNYQKVIRGKILQRIYEGDRYFYIIVTGEIAKIGIKYQKVTTTFKEYILHLTKLQLLEENFLLNECIEKNQDIFPFKSEKNIIKLFLKIKGFDFKNELNLLKSKIKNSKWMNNPKDIEDFFSMINPSFKNGKESFLSKEMKFPLLLPYYIKDEILGPNSFIGNLLKSKGIKEFASYICVNNSDVLYIDKSIVAPGCKLINIFENRLNYSVIDNIIKRNIIFKNINIDYLINYFSKYFRLINIKKGEPLISQGRPHEGIYFINKGIFELRTLKTYYELQELIFSLRDSLDSFINYISYIKKREENDLNSEGNSNKNKRFYYKHPLFIIKANEKKDISFYSYHAPQIIGLNELYGNKTGIYHFSIYCISDEAEVYFLPNELVISLLSNDSIYNNIAGLIEERVKFLLFAIKKYKHNFESEFEKYFSMPHFSNFHLDKNAIKTNQNSKYKNILINGIQFNDIPNSISKNNILNRDKNNMKENNNIKKDSLNLNSFSSKNKNKKVLFLNEQDKNSSFFNKIKLNNSNIHSLKRQKPSIILSDNNKSLEKLGFSEVNNEKNDLSNNSDYKKGIKSPSMINIKKSVFNIFNKNDLFVNNQIKNSSFLKKNDINKTSLELQLDNNKNHNKLLPIKITHKSRDHFYKSNFLDSPKNKLNQNISLSEEKNFIKIVNNLYFRKKGKMIDLEKILDNEKEILNKFENKRKFNFKKENYDFSNMSNKNFFSFKNSFINNDLKNTNYLRHFKKIKPLNLIKSNSSENFTLEKINN